MSKNALKRLIKKQKWEENRPLIKAKKEEEKILNKLEGKASQHKKKGSVLHLARFHKEKDKESEIKVINLTKAEKQGLFKELCQKGPTIVIDCEFDHLMEDREKQSMAQ